MLCDIPKMPIPIPKEKIGLIKGPTIALVMPLYSCPAINTAAEGIPKNINNQTMD